MSLPAGSYQPFAMSFLDAGNEIGRTEGYTLTLTAENFDDQVDLWATLLAKTQAIVLGARLKDVFNDESLYNVAQPTNGAARETKLLVQGKDITTGQKFTLTIPTLNPAIPHYFIDVNAKDIVFTTEPASIVDFISALNAFWVSPITGNAIHVVGLKVVGRNV